MFEKTNDKNECDLVVYEAKDLNFSEVLLNFKTSIQGFLGYCINNSNEISIITKNYSTKGTSFNNIQMYKLKQKDTDNVLAWKTEEEKSDDEILKEITKYFE